MATGISEILAKCVERAYADGFAADRFASDEQVQTWTAVGRAGKHKYLNIERQMRRVGEIASAICLDTRTPKLRMVDLGAGPAYICLLAQELGHETLAIDIADPLYESLRDFFKIPQRIHFVSPDSIVPPGLPKFDLVTALAIKFHSVRKKYWTPAQWDRFFETLHRDVLLPDGGIYLSFNYRADQAGDPDDPAATALKAYYEDLHADLLGRGFVSPEIGIYLWGSVARTNRYGI